MISDALNQFSLSQAVTTAAASTNVLDTSIARDIGTGENLYILTDVTVALVGASVTDVITLETATDAAFTSPITLQTLYTIPAVSAIGYKAIARIQPDVAGSMLEFLRLKHTPTGGAGSLTAGSFTSEIIHDVDKFVTYKSGFTVK